MQSRITLSVFAAIALLATQGVARAQRAPRPVPRAERAAIRTAVRAEAHSFIRTLEGRIDHPSVRVQNVQRARNGAVHVEAGIYGRGGWALSHGARVRLYEGKFEATRAHNGSVQVRPVHTAGRVWSPIYYMAAAPGR